MVHILHPFRFHQQMLKPVVGQLQEFLFYRTLTDSMKHLLEGKTDTLDEMTLINKRMNDWGWASERKELFLSMLRSSSNDHDMRLRMSNLWLQYLLSSGEFNGYEVKKIGSNLRIRGPYQNEYISFEYMYTSQKIH